MKLSSKKDVFFDFGNHHSVIFYFIFVLYRVQTYALYSTQNEMKITERTSNEKSISDVDTHIDRFKTSDNVMRTDRHLILISIRNA